MKHYEDEGCGNGEGWGGYLDGDGSEDGYGKGDGSARWGSGCGNVDGDGYGCGSRYGLLNRG